MITSTPPIGYDDQGRAVEEVITTATRLPASPWPAILAGAGVGVLLALLLSDRRGPGRSARRGR